METADAARVNWRKSTRSNGSGNCEVANVSGAIGVRDSKNIGGGMLAFEPGHWSTFISAVKTDRLSR